MKVEEHEPPPGGGGGGETGGGAGGGGSTPPPGGGGGVLHAQEAHNPRATLAGTNIVVSKRGALTLKVSCPAGQSICTGTVTLRTLTAVSAKAKKSILTLASGSFSLAGGHSQPVTLHLSAKARKLLARSHSLRAAATLVSHDSTTTLTTKQNVLLRAAKH